MRKRNEIKQWILPYCLQFIDLMNKEYDNYTKQELKKIADDDKSNEGNIINKFTHPFHNFVDLNFQSKSCDINVYLKNYIIEFKFLRNFRSDSGTYTNKLNFDDCFKKNYTWLCDEIKQDLKGKRAFLIGWYNAVDRFSEIVYLGEGSGSIPNLNLERLHYFPFINHKENSFKITDIFYMYSLNCVTTTLLIPSCKSETVNCIFIGKESDKFHFALYW